MIPIILGKGFYHPLNFGNHSQFLRECHHDFSIYHYFFENENEIIFYPIEGPGNGATVTTETPMFIILQAKLTLKIEKYL